MATNEILRFAETDTGTNLLTQAEYLADSQRPIGNQPGVARSKLVNKALRQASLIAAGLAEYIADNQANNITDALTPQNIADYLQAALTGALGVTPPQFDNDTSLATTQFVQRALGNMSGFSTYSANATFPASDAGKYIAITGGTAYALPAAGIVAVGAKFTIAVAGTAPSAITISVGGGGTIAGINNNPSSATMAMQPGSSCEFVAVDPGVYSAINGSGIASLAANGYQKMPSGLIIQWGVTPVIAGGSNSAITLPIASPVATECVITNFANEGADIAVADYRVAQVRARTLTTFTLRNLSSSASQYFWIAICR